MCRPPLEVADLICAAGAAFIERSRNWISWEASQSATGHSRGVAPPHSAVISMSALAADVAPSPTTHAETGIARSVRPVLANRWLEARRRELLPTRYVHVVFTLPRELAPLALQNKKLIYDLLFRTSAETLLEVARDPKHLGAEIGFFSVLHTWNQKLELHPHVHCVVPAGGLSPDHTRWIKHRYDFFLPVKVLSRVFPRQVLCGAQACLL